jgi:hypothetical protein
MKFTLTFLTVLSIVCASGVQGQNLLQNPGFEDGGFANNNTFVDNLNSLSLTSQTSGHNGGGNTLNYWGTDAAQWIEDSSRSTEGNRFLWLPGGLAYCAGQELGFGVGQPLQGGSTYRFSFDFAAVSFDGHPDPGSQPGNSTSLGTVGTTGGRLELNWVDSAGGIISILGDYPTEQLTNGFAGGPLSLQNVVTWNSLVNDVGTGGSGWYRGFIDVTLPGAGPSGATGILVSLSNSNNPTLEAGLAIDNASVVLVPEPSALALLGAVLLPVLRRRR